MSPIRDAEVHCGSTREARGVSFHSLPHIPSKTNKNLRFLRTARHCYASTPSCRPVRPVQYCYGYIEGIMRFPRMACHSLREGPGQHQYCTSEVAKQNNIFPASPAWPGIKEDRNRFRSTKKEGKKSHNPNILMCPVKWLFFTWSVGNLPSFNQFMSTHRITNVY